MSVIMIARGALSAASHVGKSLAEVLGYPLATREDVYASAKAYGIEASGLGDLSFVDERPPSFWRPFDDNRRQYLTCMQAALIDRALGGDLVYVGHFAHLLLGSYRRVLRVRLAAPEAYRVETLQRERRMSRGEALAYVREIDERRLRWSRFLYGVDWREPQLYDLVLNPERIRVQTLTEVIVALATSIDMQQTAHDREQLQSLRLEAISRAALLRSLRTRGLALTVVSDARRSRLVVYGMPPGLGADTWERDITSVLAQIDGVAAIDVVPGEPPPAA